MDQDANSAAALVLLDVAGAKGYLIDLQRAFRALYIDRCQLLGKLEQLQQVCTMPFGSQFTCKTTLILLCMRVRRCCALLFCW